MAQCQAKALKQATAGFYRAGDTYIAHRPINRL